MNIDRRSFLGAGLAALGAARSAPSPVAAAAPAGQSAAARASSGRSLSRQFAQWVVGLRYEDLPANRGYSLREGDSRPKQLEGFREAIP